MKRDQNKTGGGPSELHPLSTLEEKLLSIMGTTALDGDNMIQELGFGKVGTVIRGLPRGLLSYIYTMGP